MPLGETRRLNRVVPVGNLGFHDDKEGYVVEIGEFQIWVGGSSRASLTAFFQVDGGLVQPPMR